MSKHKITDLQAMVQIWNTGGVEIIIVSAFKNERKKFNLIYCFIQKHLIDNIYIE